ncbi:hypothetical protein [Sphingopyxis sp. KK2]|uniref:hypothetical protein n=1 Tax=Sphingopyxis sp. KK2 TaxID=1855727 RepID=UPI00097E6B74|nr:hypothetical protein [Sphingopyxis sp. KK2]
MIGARALGAAALSDAGPRDLASEYPGPRVDAARSGERGRRAGSQAGERRVVVRRDGKPD